MAALERSIHAEDDGLPDLVRAALVHVQFETIHPFLDGNGRVGWLLIVLMLFDAGVLDQPLLYLSLYFKQHRDEYYRLLDSARSVGDWEAWLEFFLEGVTSTAGSAVETAHRLVALNLVRTPATHELSLAKRVGQRFESARRLFVLLNEELG